MAVIEWLPIETAPKDGKYILALTLNKCGRKVRVIAQWVEQFSLSVGDEPYGDEWGEWHEPSGDFYCPEGWYEITWYSPDVMICHIHDELTHWMPLPAPPIDTPT